MDPPFTPEIEILDIDGAYFDKKKWANFKDLHNTFDDIVQKLIDDYPKGVQQKNAAKKLRALERLVS